jgi:hypothetical protein
MKLQPTNPEVVSGSVWPPKCTKSFGGRAAGAKEGPGFQLSRKSDPIIRAQFGSRMHQNSPTSICICKNFPGLYSRTPTKGRGREGRDGERRERAGNCPGLGQKNYGHLTNDVKIPNSPGSPMDLKIDERHAGRHAAVARKLLAGEHVRERRRRI